ncbi:hypothetical protein ABID29_001162 [Streptococcus rupicaprae]|uniref:DUF721 domain-containing protein n=1 Tax=Streptococcus rupicaprae TaxID=759619 RepID=A0ABV2FHK9_9STRE
MIKLEKIEQTEVEKFCCEIYDKLKKRHINEIKSINKWIFNFFKSVPNSNVRFTATGDNLFQIMVADYNELFLLKQFIDSSVNYEKFTKRMTRKIRNSRPGKN